jgi:hypothetical protein
MTIPAQGNRKSRTIPRITSASAAPIIGWRVPRRREKQTRFALGTP